MRMVGKQSSRRYWTKRCERSIPLIDCMPTVAPNSNLSGRRLAELMIEHNIGVGEEHAYRIKKIDSDYFEEA